MKSSNLYLRRVLLLLLLLCTCTLQRASTTQENCFSVMENSPTGFELGRIRVDHEGSRYYRFSTEGILCGNYFNINPDTSTLSVRQQELLDREALLDLLDADDDLICLVNFNVFVTEQNSTEVIQISIQVLDENDEEPHFFGIGQPHTVDIYENVAVPTTVVSLQPVDRDRGRNGTTHFYISSGNVGDYFRIVLPLNETNLTTTSRDIQLQKHLNFETIGSNVFNLTILIHDMGETPHEYVQIILIRVQNIPDEPPRFHTTSYTFPVSENHPVDKHQLFAFVNASSSEQRTGIVLYSMDNDDSTDIVGLDNITGGLYLKRHLDYEESRQDFSFTVIASNPNTRQQANARVYIKIIDINDEAPYFMCFDCDRANATDIDDANGTDFIIEENEIYAGNLIVLRVKDRDISPEFKIIAEESIQHYVDPAYAPVRINVRMVSPTFVLLAIILFENSTVDRERIPVITVTLTAENTVMPLFRVNTTLRIIVDDVNDNPPVFSGPYHGSVFEGSPVEREILRVEAADEDIDENGAVSYSISSVQPNSAANWFEISPADGTVRVSSPTIGYLGTMGTVILYITATDNGMKQHLTATTVANITIVPSTTFVPNSYLEYSASTFDLLSVPNATIYLEYRSPEPSGLLLFQQDSTGRAFSLQLQQNTLVARLGDDAVNVTVGRTGGEYWVPVLVEISQTQITALRVGSPESSELRHHLLRRELVNQRCVNTSEGTAEDHQSSLYIGGVNVFRLHPNSTAASRAITSFVGGIRNIVVGGIQLICPLSEVNTVIGYIRSNGCDTMRCSSSRSTSCVDYAAESYCQCLGGFSSAACKISNTVDEETSYAPISFKGSTQVRLNLDYTFFHDLYQQTNNSKKTPSTETSSSATSKRKRRRRETVDPVLEEVLQTLELQFRAMEVRNSVLLYSRTASSTHLLEIFEHSDGNSYVGYTTSQAGQSRNTRLTLPLTTRTLYHLTVTITSMGIFLNISEASVPRDSSWMSWDTHPVSLYAEEPHTTLSIGGRGDDLSPSITTNSGRFAGCISRVAIDGIEIPLSGLLSASTGEGGFEVDDGQGVERFCDLCGITSCPASTVCTSDKYGETLCGCTSSMVLINGTCAPLMVGTQGPILTEDTENSIYYIIGGVAGAIVVLVVIIAIIIFLSKREKKKKNRRLYSINHAPVSDTDSSSRSRTSNNYTPSHPKQHRSSFTSSTNANCASDSQMGTSTVNSLQGNGEAVNAENSISLHHHSARGQRKSCSSIESAIKMEDEKGTLSRGIPQMDDSGHEVNSTDSAHTFESDEIASSCSNDQLHHPSTTLKARESVSNADQHAPHTPLTPREKKVMIPLRPPSINLSQSEYDEEEVTDTESFHTRVSSSSGMGGSMQNQGRGSDSENSKTSGSSTPQWYHDTNMSEGEREKRRLQASRPYYPKPSHSDKIPSGMGPYPPGIQIPPMYHSPPTFSEHIDRNWRSRSTHGGAPQSMAVTERPKVPRSYENYPQPFGINGAVRSNILANHNQQHMQPPNHKGQGYHDRRSSERTLDEQEYVPAPLLARQYSDPRIPRNGNYCNPRMHSDQWPLAHSRQMSDPHQSSQQSEDTAILPPPRGSHSTRHVNIYPSGGSTPTSNHSIHPADKDHRQFFTMGHIAPEHHNYGGTNQQTAQRFHSGDPAVRTENYHTLNSLSRLDPITNWDAQDRMKVAVDSMDPCHLLSGPCIPFEYVSTDPSVVESQMTMDDSMMGDVFESEGGEGISHMLGPLNRNMVRLREDEIDSILTDSEVGHHIMNHFPSADCSSQYTGTIVAGSTSSSGESTPKLQKVFVLPPSQQSFDV